MVQASYWEGVMPRQYEEKRNFHRMSVDCALSFNVLGDKQAATGQCKNLSATGVLFETFHPMSIGSRIQINITPQKSVVAPLNAVAEIVRVEHRGAKNIYQIAARITQLT